VTAIADKPGGKPATPKRWGLRRYLVAGVLVWLPILATIWMVTLIVHLMDRTLVGHPAVQAATYWGITDEGAWLGAPGGLVRADGTPKPAYDALRRLVKDEWWLAPTTVRTSSSGQLPVSGFLGTYSVDGVPFDLSQDGEVVVRLEG